MVKRAVFVIALVAVRAALAAPPMVPIGERHFDHAAHDRAMHVPCARCHPTSGKSGVLLDDGHSVAVDHGTCEGSGCHGTGFTGDTRCATVKEHGRERVCALCHVQPSCFTPAPPSVDHMQAHFAHGRHAPFGVAIESKCALCHTSEAAGPRPSFGAAHRGCASCHDDPRNKVPMTACEGCHTGADMPAMRPPAAGLAFDHGAHAKSAPRAACLGCHAAPPASTDSFAQVDAPMLGCQHSCHDGKRAFAATGATCTRCHRGSEPAAATQLAHGFSHAQHAKLGAQMAACDGCHSLAADGTLRPPLAGKDHQPCATSGCHEAEFAQSKTTICGVCHDAVAPWQKAVARASDASAVREWFTSIDHASHLRRTSGPDSNAACTTCHAGQMSAQPERRDHRACAPCHGSGTAPAMTACAACHTSTAPAGGPASQWSVAASFRHVTHTDDPRTHAATSCAACHAQITTATDLASIRAPTMQSCDACHDGKLAFKSTGFACARCHTKQPVHVSMTP